MSSDLTVACRLATLHLEAKHADIQIACRTTAKHDVCTSIDAPPSTGPDTLPAITSRINECGPNSLTWLTCCERNRVT